MYRKNNAISADLYDDDVGVNTLSSCNGDGLASAGNNKIYRAQSV